jgi:hypothetical protein
MQYDCSTDITMYVIQIAQNVNMLMIFNARGPPISALPQYDECRRNCRMIVAMIAPAASMIIENAKLPGFTFSSESFICNVAVFKDRC